MITRLSTSGFHQRALGGMQVAQSQLARVQEQLALGTRLTRAADDPAAAGTAVALDRAIAAGERFRVNADRLAGRLQQQDDVLAGVGDLLARLREIALQANNATLDAAGRAALVPQMQSVREHLLALANSQDAQGRYLFAGSSDAGPPVVAQSGGVAWVGDDMQRRIDVSPVQSVADTDPGQALFMQVPTGSGGVAARAATGNAGSGVIVAAGLTDAAAWDGDSYRVIYRVGPPTGYQVWNSSNALVTSGTWTDGATVAFRGYQITLAGNPVHGDTFTVAPAANEDLFGLVDRLVAAVQGADTPATTRAARTNALFAGIEDLARAGEHVSQARASTGTRLAMLETVASEREAIDIGVRETLSGLRDLDYAEALTRLERQSTALEALQRTYTRIQSMSLFDFLR